MNKDELYMSRCLELASNGLGRTYPNPLVGSIIVWNDKIIGEGFHVRAGSPHAEVIAVNSVKDTKLLKDSTLYVNLEPCSHWGKTPPCSDMIIRLGIKRVVVGTTDPNPLVAGRGIAKMRAAGVDVKTGVLEKQCLEINKRFFTFHTKKRPYIILKWAQSADGFIDKNFSPIRISGEQSKYLVHRWRTEEQAIIVGTQTVINDNPQLTARYWYGKNPLRVCIDTKGRIDKNSKIFDSNAETICLKGKEYYNADAIINYLFDKGIQSVIVEGGRKMLQSFIEAELWDEARIFVSDKILFNGTKAPLVSGNIEKNINLDSDKLLVIKH